MKNMVSVLNKNELLENYQNSQNNWLWKKNIFLSYIKALTSYIIVVDGWIQPPKDKYSNVRKILNKMKENAK